MRSPEERVYGLPYPVMDDPPGKYDQERLPILEYRERIKRRVMPWERGSNALGIAKRSGGTGI